MMNTTLRKSSGRVIAVLITIALILSYAVPVQSVFAETEEPANYLKNPGFETDIWDSANGWTVKCETTWDNTTTKWADDSSSNAVPKDGTHTFNFWTQDAQVISVTQWLDLEPGDYVLSGNIQGGSVTPILFVKQGDTVIETAEASVGGWNSWSESSMEFTIEEAGNYSVGVLLDNQAGGWGYIDACALTEKVTGEEPDPEDPDDPDNPGGDDPVVKEPSSINIEPVENVPEDFLMGVDISSYISLQESGVVFKNQKGEPEDFMKILSDAGVNSVRVRIWNDPFDSEGNSYGGGGNDLARAVEICKDAAKYNIGVLLDVQYSDFWAQPTIQSVPKAWNGYSLSQKEKAIGAYTTKVLTEVEKTGVRIDMIQIGNETNAFFCGEKDWTNICKLFNAGCKAVRAYDPDIKVAIHFAGRSDAAHVTWADTLAKNNVDYDVYAVSYYTFYSHGHVDNTVKNMNAIVAKYGKEICLAETSYPYTFDDSDGHSNNMGLERYLGILDKMKWDVSVQGQAQYMRDLIESLCRIKDTDGNVACKSVYYWEPAWITVGDTTGLTGDAWQTQYDKNMQKWEKFGSGWGSSYAGEYSNNAKNWYGGSSWDNQAMFAPDGTAMDSLNVFKYVRTGSKATGKSIVSVETPEVTIEYGDVQSVQEVLPGEVTVNYADGTQGKVAVKRWIPESWDAADAAIAGGDEGTYSVYGYLTDDLFSQVVVKITVIPSNKVKNSGFEGGSMDGWTVTGDQIAWATQDDPHSGSYGMHFSTQDDFSFEVSQTIEGVDAGTYRLEAWMQGWLAEGGSAELWYEQNGERHSISEVLDGWANWKNPMHDRFDLEAGDVTVGVSVSGKADEDGSWQYGTIDEIKLYAPKQYSLSYDANKGTTVKSVSVLPKTVSTYFKGDSAAVAGAVTSTNRFFNGWNTQANGKGTAYAKGDELTMSGNTTLYATWKQYYTAKNGIKYVVNGRKTVKAYGYSGTSKVVTVPSTITVNGVTYKVTAIGARAFKNKKLTKVTVGKYVKTVGDYAFSSNSKLKTVILGSGVTSIGKGILNGSYKTCYVTIKSTKITKGNMLRTSKSNMTIKVPKTKYKKYKSLLKISKMKGKVKYKK